MGLKLDTCAAYSVASPDKKKYGERLTVPAAITHVEGLGGKELRVEGVWRFRLKTEYDQIVILDALVVEGCSNELILGVDFLEEKNVNISFSTKEATYKEEHEKVIIPFKCEKTKNAARAIRLVRGKKIATRTLTVLKLPVDAEEGTVGLFQPTARTEARLLVAPTMTTVRGGNICVPVLNVLGKRTKLPARKDLGTWIPIQEDVEALELGGELDPERVAQWVKELSGGGAAPLPNEEEVQLDHLDVEKKDLMLQLLRNFPGVATADRVCPPSTKTGVRHYIPTGTAAPIRQRRFRNSVHENTVIADNIKVMLEHGVVEMANGPWGFPVVLVKKKDGSVRFCVDYRALNAVTVKDVYPLPRIDETLEALGGAQWFTTFDLMAGYWQVEVAPEDRDKTAFLTREGLYRFVRMPFGLSNAPSTFQRLMDCVLRGLLWVCCLVYLDDILVFSRGTFEQHVVELAVVLARLEDAGLTIKLRKCQFACDKIEYLGHELSSEGVRPTERLVQAVVKCPEPKDEKEVKRFVHLAGYYRRFIEGFGSKMAPLTKLLRKSVEWQWGDEQREAFELIKRELSTKPLLQYPDFQLPFVLATDASMVGLGAALMQDFGRGLQPIGYASKVNNEAQSNYPITELECLAVVWAVQFFRPYLYGREFTVVTDHHALKWLMSARDLRGKLQRWALALQEYNFTLQFRPGKENVVPDALSRAPVLQVTGVEETAEVQWDGVQVDDATIVRHQAESKMCRDALKTGKIRDQLVERRGGVVKVCTEGDGWKVLLPPTLWAAVLKECHDSIWAGHLMGKQTLARVAKNFWWPSRRKIVFAWTASCRDCGSRKVRPRRIIPPLRSVKVGAVGDRWALDVAGPLPVTHTGKRYVVALVEYVTKFVVAVPTENHTAPTLAMLLVNEVVFKYGPFRELLMDGAPEMQSDLMAAMVQILQAKQTTPVPYRPNLMGLVERFNRTWKDMVSMYVSRNRNDWDEWVSAMAYAYNSAENTVTGFAPFFLMTGREPRAPRDLLLKDRVEDVGKKAETREWHGRLRQAVEVAREVAKEAIEKEQRRQARYYDRQQRRDTAFVVGELVWVHRPPENKKKTKLRHRWVGPCRVEGSAGYDNFRVTALEDGKEMLAHESLMLHYSEPLSMLETVAADLEDQFLEDEDEDAAAEARTGVRTRAQRAARAATVSGGQTARTMAVRGVEKRRVADVTALLRQTPAGVFYKECRRKKERNLSGRYEMPIEVEFLTGPSEGRRVWMTMEEFEMLWGRGVDVEDDAQTGPGE